MNDAARLGQALHEQTRTSGVIEMNVRQEDVFDVGNAEALLLEGVE